MDVSASLPPLDAERALGKLLVPVEREQSLGSQIAKFRRLTGQQPENFDAWLQLGAALAQDAQLAPAIEALRRAVDLKPESAEALNNLGANLFESGGTVEALELFRKATHSDPSHGDAWNNLALALASAGQTDEAHAAATKATALTPKLPRVWNTLGLVCGMQGRAADALEAFDHAVKLDSNYAIGWHNRGRALYLARDFSGARSSFQRAMAANRKFVPPLVMLARLSTDEGRIADASRYAALATKISPSNGEVWGISGFIQVRQAHWAEAAEALGKARSLGQKDADTLSLLGLALTEEKRFAEAEAVLEEGQRAFPAHIDMALNFAVLRQRQGKFKESADLYRKLLQDHPEHALAWNNLAGSLIGTGDLPEATRAATEATKLSPGDPEFWMTLGLVQERQKHFAESAAALRKGVELKPDFAAAWSLLALVTEDPKAAERAAEKLMAIDPGSAESHLVMGRVQLRNHRAKESALILRKAVQLDPKRADLQYWLGMALLAGGSGEGAVVAARRATELDPKFPAGWQVLGIAATQAQRFDEAMRAFGELILLMPLDAGPHVMLGETHLQRAKGDPKSVSLSLALKEFALAVEMDPKLVVAWTDLNACQVALGRSEDARKSAEHIAALGGRIAPPQGLDSQPTSFTSLDQRARALLREGKLKEAISLLLELQKMKPDDLALLERILEPLGAAAMHEDAIRLATDAARRFPGDSASHRCLGTAFLRSGRYEEALVEFETAVRLGANTAGTWFGLSLTKGMLKRWDEAIEAGCRAVLLAPDDERYWQAVHDCYRGNGDALGSEAKIKALLAEKPDAAPGWFFLGAIQAEAGMAQIGLRNLRKAVELRPEYANAWNAIGLGLLKGKTAEEKADSIKAFERAVKADPFHAEAWNNLGWGQFNQGELDQSILSFRSALRANPRHTRALVNLTRALVTKGDRTSARASCAQLAGVDPTLATNLKTELNL